MKKLKIAVGLSGGVDSAVSAALLKEQGHEVFGLFMKNWDEKDERGVCLATRDYADVVKICAQLDIPCKLVNYVKEYKENVFAEFLQEYEKGNTPNPDILCNREIKFKVFFQQAMALGADALATGHYCQSLNGLLYKGLDPLKDQSYFLSAINRDVLNRVIFPLGGICKTKVRELARQWQLPVSEKKDSTGICFIGERNFKNFLGKFLAFQKGPLMTLDGQIVGNHDGVAYYTLGQRKGLGLGGPGEPWFVVKKDIESNIVYVERGQDHPAMYASSLKASQFNWIGPASKSGTSCFAKVRYRQEDQPCQLFYENENDLEIRFSAPQRAITPKQTVVLYQDDEFGRRCLGGGLIEQVGESLFEKQSLIAAHL
jgi:tRNA-specific 2-thiouridylase